jgi:hypothetical protein
MKYKEFEEKFLKKYLTKVENYGILYKMREIQKLPFDSIVTNNIYCKCLTANTAGYGRIKVFAEFRRNRHTSVFLQKSSS